MIEVAFIFYLYMLKNLVAQNPKELTVARGEYLEVYIIN